MDWPGLVRKYVWDQEKTPYLVRPERLTPAQARSELFTYAFLLAILASVVAVAAAVGEGGGALGPGVALYALTLAGAAVALGATGRPGAAGYCATAPVAMAIAALLGLLRPGMTGTERVVLAALGALWLGYAVRVVRIARRLRAP